MVTLEPTYEGRSGDTAAAAALGLLSANDVASRHLRCVFGSVATHALLDAAHQVSGVGR